MGIQARGNLGTWYPGSMAASIFSAGSSSIREQQCRVGEHHVFHALDGRDQGLPGADDGFILTPRDKARTQKRADQTPAGGETLGLHTFLERLHPRRVPVGARFE